ncbi:MAG TPA: amino acid adenylation domain-containing protein [Terriglobia bacterium]|nr:amino acid adenylation domain-containing protein [Terriglobia bacterium]
MTHSESFIANPGQKVANHQILSEAERRKILLEWNHTQVDRPAGATVHGLVEQQAKRTPEAPAVEQCGRRMSFGDLDARANQLAHFLIKAGVKPDEPVGVSMERSPEMAVALLGTLKAGGACLPLDPGYPRERLEFMCLDAKVRILITQPGLVPELTDLVPQKVLLTPGLKSLAEESSAKPALEVSPEHLAYVIYTSGSTGTPRGVELPHRGIANHQLAAMALYSLRPEDRVLQFSSISFDIAIEEMFPTWSAGGCVVLRDPALELQAKGFMRWLRHQGITVVDLPTAFWHEWVHQLAELRKPLPETLRLVIVGGEKASASAYAAWKGLAGRHVRWINTYGPTEASVIATAYDPEADPGREIPSELPVGRPVENVKAYILDSELEPVAVGATGELHIGGWGLARGYLNRPELTAEKFISDPFSLEPGARLYKTGDLACFGADGNILFHGRRDDQIKINGFRVELGEIESALSACPGIDEVAVIVREDTPGHRRLAAYFVAGRSHPPATSTIRDYLRAKLPEYMVPAHFVSLPSLPVTPNGKVDRRALPAPEQARHGTSRPEPLAGDSFEARMVKIWESVLNTSHIGLQDNFFDLGGTSLLAARMIYKVERSFGKTLPTSALLEAPTVKGVCGILRQQGRTQKWSSLVPIQSQGTRPTFFCVHGLGGTVLLFKALAKYLGPDQPVYGLQAQGLDGVHPFHVRVEDMAEHYVKEMRSIQPQGPYYLGGYSFGGYVCLEMARRLRQAGQEVGLLGLFDTFPEKEKSNTSLLLNLLSHSPGDWVSFFYRKSRGLIKHWIAIATFPQVLKNAWHACSKAERDYRLRPYQGEAALFIPSKESIRSSQDPAIVWGRWITEGVEVHEIPGDHGSIMREPLVRNLAENIRECLDRAMSQRTKDRRTPP